MAVIGPGWDARGVKQKMRPRLSGPKVDIKSRRSRWQPVVRATGRSRGAGGAGGEPGRYLCDARDAPPPVESSVVVGLCYAAFAARLSQSWA